MLPIEEKNAELDRASMEALAKLTKDLKAGAGTMTKVEARFIVDTYYRMQDARIRNQGQIRAISQKADEGETHFVLSFFLKNFEILENQMKHTLQAYAESSVPGRWLKSICGIGPVISAGLLAHVDVTRAKYAGQVWRYAGICNPKVDKWEKGQKRPFNQKLKTLIVFKAGESFVKVQNKDNDIYGKIFAQRKREYIRKNQEGLLSAAAREVLASKNIGKTTDAYKWYAGCYRPELLDDFYGLTSEQQKTRMKKYEVEPGEGQPMLPPAHIHARARRMAGKLFVSHFHEVLFFNMYGILPEMPYVIDCVSEPAHRDYIPVPNLEEYPEMLEAYRKHEARNRALIIKEVNARERNNNENYVDTPITQDETLPQEPLREAETGLPIEE
jgi:hypothetical protein